MFWLAAVVPCLIVEEASAYFDQSGKEHKSCGVGDFCPNEQWTFDLVENDIDLLTEWDTEAEATVYAERRVETAEDTFQQGIDYAEIGRFLEAAKRFKAAYMMEPSNTLYLTNAAVALMDVSRTERSWGAAKMSAKIFSEVLGIMREAGEDLEHAQNNLQNLHDLIRESFLGETCEFDTCPKKPESLSEVIESKSRGHTGGERQEPPDDFEEMPQDDPEPQEGMESDDEDEPESIPFFREEPEDDEEPPERTLTMDELMQRTEKIRAARRKEKEEARGKKPKRKKKQKAETPTPRDNAPDDTKADTQARSKPELPLAATLDSICFDRNLKVTLAENGGAGPLSEDMLRKAAKTLRTCGVVALDRVYDDVVVNALKAAQLPEQDTRQSQGTGSDARAASLRGRTEVLAPFEAPFTAEGVAGSETLLSLVQEVVRDVVVDSIYSVQSASDSEEEHWRRLLPFTPDTSAKPSGGQVLDTQSLTVFIPLVNLTETNSPLRMLLKSHLPCAPTLRRQILPHEGVEDCGHADKVFQSYPLSAGSAIIFDSRLLYTSDPNVSPQDRAAVQITYNKAAPRGLGLRHERHTRAFDALPGRMRRLLSNWDTRWYTHILESKLSSLGVSVTPLQSTYFYSPSDEAEDMPATDTRSDAYDYELLPLPGEEL
eukprot:TRINITY_DN38234_c0_g1_i2.p1 TRINITY_DN38234_c0_g1~~TRINITY_DN38234_c0_g1_i2.p1  ORF type:complete len:659 (+),score=95.68 TRINITY_DN38234_c0_g1_i2:56-2032(+)